MKWQRTRPRYDISMLIYMYKNIWTVKACGGGGGGGGDVVFPLTFAENGRVRPFSNNYDDDCRCVQNILQERF